MKSMRRRAAAYALLRVLDAVAVVGAVALAWFVVSALFSLEPA